MPAPKRRRPTRPHGGANAWGAPAWQQALLEASLAWATGVAYHSDAPSFAPRARYTPRPRLGPLSAWVFGVRVHAYAAGRAPAVFPEGWGVVPSRREVWVSQALLERILDPARPAQGSWHADGWEELWVRAAAALGAPPTDVDDGLAAACARERLKETWEETHWPPPEVVGEAAAGPSAAFLAAVASLPTGLPLGDVEALGVGVKRWRFAVPTPWLAWVAAARWDPDGPDSSHRAFEALEEAMASEDLGAFAFWVARVGGGLEAVRPGLLGKATHPDMVPPLAARGAHPRAWVPEAIGGGEQCILEQALSLRPTLVAALLDAGACWEDVDTPDRAHARATLGAELGSALACESPAILEALDRLPADLVPPGVVEAPSLAPLVRSFVRSHRFRTTPGEVEAATTAMVQGVSRLLPHAPQTDLHAALVALAEGYRPAFAPALPLLAAACIPGLNAVTSPNGRPLASFVLFTLSMEGREEVQDTAVEAWEAAGLTWDTAGRDLELGPSSAALLGRIQARQRARELDAAYAPVAVAPRPRM